MKNMNKVYEIEIEEILQKVVKIEANSLDEAISIAEDRYNNQEYELNENNINTTKFREYKDEVIREKKAKSRESR